MLSQEQGETQTQTFVDAMCEMLACDISCHVSYTQITSNLGLLSEDSNVYPYYSASTGAIAGAEAPRLHQEISERFYNECFPHFETIALPKSYEPSHGDISAHGKRVPLMSHFDFSKVLLILPVFGPLNNMAVFAIDVFSITSVQDLNLENRAILSRIYMAAQNCHIHALTHTLRATQSNLPKLTRRERQILIWISRGKSNSIIAEILGLSLHTVNGYIRNIYLKTQTNDRTSAAVYALSAGLLHEKNFHTNAEMSIAI